MLTVAPGSGKMRRWWQPLSRFLLFMGKEREEQTAWFPGESAPHPSTTFRINKFFSHQAPIICLICDIFQQ